MGLTRAAREDPGSREAIRRVLALQYLPALHIDPVFTKIKQKTVATAPLTKLLDLDYVQDTWLTPLTFPRTPLTSERTPLTFPRAPLTPLTSPRAPLTPRLLRLRLWLPWLALLQARLQQARGGRGGESCCCTCRVPIPHRSQVSLFFRFIFSAPSKNNISKNHFWRTLFSVKNTYFSEICIFILF